MERIELIKGDITKLDYQAIVNAANEQLAGGGGVDGAIHKAAGPILHEECMRVIFKIGKCETGEAVITSAGDMPSKYVIHTVGPVWKDGNNNEAELLSKAYKSVLELACDFNLQEIAFPNISTGIYGFPKEQAAKIAVNTVSDFIKKNNFIKKVAFVCFEDDNYNLYKELLKA